MDRELALPSGNAGDDMSLFMRLFRWVLGFPAIEAELEWHHGWLSDDRRRIKLLEERVAKLEADRARVLFSVPRIDA